MMGIAAMTAEENSQTLPPGVDPDPSVATGTAVSRGQSAYAVVLIMLIMGMNQLDRGIVAILLDSIKSDMKLSDTMMALITGSGFAIIYTLAAIPFGRLGDRYSRKWIIGLGVIFYSVMASLMGLAQSVTQLALARGAVAIGEASGSASSSSLISDYYGTAKRARALSLWAAGSYLGLSVGLVIGGELHQKFGWRTALWGTAAPGIVLGILMLLTVKEPVRGASDADIRQAGPAPMIATLRAIVSQPSYLYLCAAMISQSFVIYAFSIWVPSLLSRLHHFGPAQVGLYSGLKGMFSMFGVLGGGFIAQSVAGSRLRELTTIPILAAVVMPFAMFVFLFAPSEPVSLFALFVGSVMLPVHQAPAIAMVHGVIRPNMRSFATTMALVSMALSGLALGPLMTGMVSDYLTPRLGAEALRYALAIPTMFGFLTIVFLVLARRNLERDSRRLLES